MTHTAFVDSLVDGFDVQFETNTPPACVEFDFEPKRVDEKESEWRFKQAFGGLVLISGIRRPDIVDAVRAVARQAHNPAERICRRLVR